MRRCGKCGEEKPLDDFAWRRRAIGKRDNYCRPCRKAYKKGHYAANRQRYLDLAAARKRRVRERNVILLVAYLREHPCVDCGETDPLVLEFDHRGDKSFTIACALRDKEWELIVPEIEKCDVRCANCHRRRTALAGGWIRAGVAQR